MNSLRLARLYRRYGLSGPIAIALAVLAYGERDE